MPRNQTRHRALGNAPDPMQHQTGGAATPSPQRGTTPPAQPDPMRHLQGPAPQAMPMAGRSGVGSPAGPLQRTDSPQPATAPQPQGQVLGPQSRGPQRAPQFMEMNRGMSPQAGQPPNPQAQAGAAQSKGQPQQAQNQGQAQNMGMIGGNQAQGLAGQAWKPNPMQQQMGPPPMGDVARSKGPQQPQPIGQAGQSKGPPQQAQPMQQVGRSK
jgi:hypothetical protein